MQRLSVPPFTLLRLAMPLLIVAFTIMALASSQLLLSVAMMVLGFGMGLAGPAFMAGASLAVSPQEQGAVAGVAGSCGPLGFTIGPLVGGMLYQIDAALPYAVAAGMYVLLLRVDALDRPPRRSALGREPMTKPKTSTPTAASSTRSRCRRCSASRWWNGAAASAGSASNARRARRRASAAACTAACSPRWSTSRCSSPCFANLKDDQQPAGTADLNITYLRPAHGRHIFADATVVKHGRQLAMIEVTIVDDEGRLCAKGRTLYAFRAAT